MNTSSKKFPKPGVAQTHEPEGDDFALEDGEAAERNAKVRGGIEVLHIKTDDSFNPYERDPDERKSGGGTRRDLRKLSEHIKLMRELEERKKREDE